MRLLLSYQSKSNNIILTLFSVLNSLLWYICADYIPKHTIRVCLFGFTLLLLLPPSIRNGPKLEATKQFHQFFAILSSLEILVTLIFPWHMLWDKTKDMETIRYVLAPHLFVFQAQIALETLVTTNAKLMFWYTVAANSYRVTALIIWVQRSLHVRYQHGDMSFPTILLPILAWLLWCCSNYFLIFIWYPLLPKVEKKTHVKLH